MNALIPFMVSMLLMSMLAAGPENLLAQTVGNDQVAQLLKQFEDTWTDDGWIPLKNPKGKPYMRTLDDQGWKARMLAFRSLVLNGDRSIPLLKEMLQSKSPDSRILAMQALSFLKPKQLRDTLIELLREDENASVRLYAADTLGTLQLGDELDWSDFKKSEKDVDVRKHAGYAAERKGTPVASETITSLRNWDPKSMMSARLGEAAPDFSLKSANGKTIRLSQYKDKKAIVLVFIYGDT